MVRIVVSDPENGRSFQIEPKRSQGESLVGLEIGDTFDGEKIGLMGYKLKITGGSDEEGFSMLANVRGGGRVRALLSKGTGYRPKKRGERRRKTVRGNRVSEKIVQLNTKVVERGQKPIEQILGLEVEENETEKREEVEEVEGEEVETEEKSSTEEETGENES